MPRKKMVPAAPSVPAPTIDVDKLEDRVADLEAQRAAAQALLGMSAHDWKLCLAATSLATGVPL